MNRLHLYILRQLVVALLFIILALTGAVWLTQALRFLEFTVTGGAPIGQFLTLAVYTLPPFLGVVLPVALCVSIVFIYNRMLNDSELTVMRAVGMSPVNLARPGLVLTAIVAMVVLVMEVFLAPRAQWLFSELKNDLRAAVPVNLIRDRAFMEVTEGVTVYIDERARGGRLTGIYIHDARQPDRVRIYTAGAGELIQTADGPRIVVYDTFVHQLEEDPRQLRLLRLPEYTIDLQAFAGRREPGRKGADDQTIWEILDSLEVARAQGQERQEQRLLGLLHKHFLMPLFALGMGAVTVLLLLTARFSRHGQAGRILITSAAAGGIQGLALLSVNLVLRDAALAPLAYGLSVLPLAAALAIPHLGRRRAPPPTLAQMAPKEAQRWA